MNLWAWVIKSSVLIWHGVVAIVVVRGLCRGVAEAETTTLHISPGKQKTYEASWRVEHLFNETFLSLSYV